MERAATRGRDLVKGLVGFSRKGLSQFVPVNVNDLVRQEMALLERTLLQKYELAVDLEEDLPPILGETGRLGSALMNLCVNAVDAMPGGGTLTIRTRRLSETRIQLSVEDSGEGMPPEILKKAMEPFFTTKAQGHGTGLGLATVKNTAVAHGGTFTLQSEAGKGTIASLQLPVAAILTGMAAGSDQAPAPMPSRLILLVDDDDLLRNSVPIMLRLLGQEVEVVDGGRAALAWLEAGGHPDLVVLDVNMPGMGGLETLQRLRLLRPALPVLLATGHPDAKVMEAQHLDPLVAVINKPFSMAEIRKQIVDMGLLST